MSDPLGSPAAHRTQPRRPVTNVCTIPWGSDAARSAVARTCQAVAQRCQRVTARYLSTGMRGESGRQETANPDHDELDHVTIGDPDPTTAANMGAGYHACGFTWTDEQSSTLTLAWSCTRMLGHQGQHLAGTGQWVVAVHPCRLYESWLEGSGTR